MKKANLQLDERELRFVAAALRRAFVENFPPRETLTKEEYVVLLARVRGLLAEGARP